MQKEKHSNLAIILYFFSLLIVPIVKMIEDFSYIDVVYFVVLIWGIVKVIFITLEERR